jgi:hypothetical protein
METYNGWSNYATWRIALEWFDYDDLSDWDVDALRDFVRESLEMECENKTTLAYAMAFIDDVDWQEIHGSLQRRHNYT